MTDLTIGTPGAAQLLLDGQATAPAVRPPAQTGDPAAARAAAEDFEAVFIAQMLNHMFAGIRADGPFGGGHAETVYRSMMVNEYGRLIAQRGGLGIADHVMAEILKTQEVDAS